MIKSVKKRGRMGKNLFFTHQTNFDKRLQRTKKLHDIKAWHNIKYPSVQTGNIGNRSNWEHR